MLPLSLWPFVAICGHLWPFVAGLPAAKPKFESSQQHVEMMFKTQTIQDRTLIHCFWHPSI